MPSFIRVGLLITPLIANLLSPPSLKVNRNSGFPTHTRRLYRYHMPILNEVLMLRVGPQQAPAVVHKVYGCPDRALFKGLRGQCWLGKPVWCPYALTP